jgi:hypothetical protein
MIVMATMQVGPPPRARVVAGRQFGVLADTYGLGCRWRTVGVTVLPCGSGPWPGAELRTGG